MKPPMEARTARAMDVHPAASQRCRRQREPVTYLLAAVSHQRSSIARRDGLTAPYTVNRMLTQALLLPSER